MYSCLCVSASLHHKQKAQPGRETLRTLTASNRQVLYSSATCQSIYTPAINCSERQRAEGRKEMENGEKMTWNQEQQNLKCEN